MNKKILKKLLIILLVIMFIFSLFNFASNVNATEKKQKFVPDITIKYIPQFLDEEEKIMEYDATTGITKEVNINKLRKSLNNSNRGNINKIEPYDPILKENHAFNNVNFRATYDPILNMSILPYRAICRIKADVYGKELFASGYLAGPRILLTAAHCVMNTDDGDATFANWIAYPGYYNGRSYNGLSSGWSKIYYSSNWTSTHSAAYDWCICILNSDIGNSVGWNGTQSYGVNSEMNNLSVRLFGYPYKIGYGERQYCTNGKILNTYDYYFKSSAEPMGGFSGGPFIRTSDNYVVGLCSGHWNSTPITSAGVRITQNMINIIKENF